MELSKAEVKHLARLREEGEGIAHVNARIAALGGRMLPLRDGTPAPAPSLPRAELPAPAGAFAHRCPECEAVTFTGNRHWIMCRHCGHVTEAAA